MPPHLLAAVDRGDIGLVESTAILVEVLPKHADTAADAKRAKILELLESRTWS